MKNFLVILVLLVSTNAIAKTIVFDLTCSSDDGNIIVGGMIRGTNESDFSVEEIAIAPQSTLNFRADVDNKLGTYSVLSGDTGSMAAINFPVFEDQDLTIVLDREIASYMLTTSNVPANLNDVGAWLINTNRGQKIKVNGPPPFTCVLQEK